MMDICRVVTGNTKVLISIAFLLVTCHLPPVTTDAAQVEYHEGLPIVHLTGSPYELGRQHGEALREEVRRSIGQVLRYFRSYLKIPLVRSMAANWWLDTAWAKAASFIPLDYVEELKGLSDGSGVPLRELYRLHAIPDRTYSCSNFAAWGRATAGGGLIHVRNLDWNIGAGIQQFAAIFVVQPTGKHAFVNVGWAGFVGVLTGMNDATISIGQIGADTVDATFRGEPMVFLMRRVLEEADDLEEAASLIVKARRTVGVNYVVADAKAKGAIALETTHQHARVFRADDVAEHAIPYARPIRDAVFRADTAIDPTIRDRQLASEGDPARAGLEEPGGSAYSIRYLGQAAGILAHYGTLDATTAQDIARNVAPSSNIQSVVFAWPALWVANAQGTQPAAQRHYHQLDVRRLLERAKQSVRKAISSG